MHANAVAKLMGSWPVIVPPSPVSIAATCTRGGGRHRSTEPSAAVVQGLLCAFGDATTRTRNDCCRSFVKRFTDTNLDEILDILR